MQRNVCWILICVFIAVAIAQVVSTYGVFNHTYDEPTHINAGVQLLETGDYSGHQETPPLGRLLLATGPALYGAKATTRTDTYAANAVLYDAPSYERALTLAQIGNLPFLVLLVAVTGLWEIYLFGNRPAVVAVAALTLLPLILGHAGLATTDIACAATVLLALYAFMRWLETGSWGRTILLALTSGTAIMVKFSAIPYLGASAIAIFIWRFAVARKAANTRFMPLRLVLQLSVIAVLALAIFWLSYGLTDPFRTAVIHDKFDTGDMQHVVSRIVGKDTALFGLIRAVIGEIQFPVFVRDMIFGLKYLSAHNEKGHWNYLFGEINSAGWWYYYLVALLVKTPIPFLLLGIPAAVYTVGRSVIDRDWRLAVPILCIAAILVFTAAFSRINTGIRHILIVYPFFALAIGALIDRLWTHRRWIPLGGAGARFAWLAAGSAVAHPDYFADFNPLAGDRPERILIDSYLDWGQDLDRLRQEVRNRKIDSLSIAYYGTADVGRHLPNARELPEGQAPAGWIAVSRSYLATSPGLAWLGARPPVARIGRSINLYFVDPNATERR